MVVKVRRQYWSLVDSTGKVQHRSSNRQTIEQYARFRMYAGCQVVREPRLSVQAACKHLAAELEDAARRLRARAAARKRGGKITKLRAMTVANGCTPAEAATAVAKLAALKTCG
jgi:hypothetical protein